jgi:membrane fusion protein (multidrug efflux system)
VWGRFVAVLLVLAAIASVAMVIYWPQEVEQPEPPAPRVINVKVLPLDRIPAIDDTIRLAAVVEPVLVVKISSEVSARVERWGPNDPNLPEVRESAKVRAGDVLLSLRPDLFKAQRDRAAAELDYQQREYERVRELHQRGRTSQNEYDNARSTRDMKAAELAEMQYQLDRTVIVCPIDGILNTMMVEVGEFAVAGQAVAEVVDLSRVNVVVDVPELDVQHFKIGQSARVMTEIGDSREFTGTITYISEIADPLTRTSRMEIEIDNSERLLRSGQIVRVQLVRQTLSDILLVPLRAVIPLESGHVVYVVDAESRAQRRPVKLGFIREQEVQVRAGLEAGDRLIIEGHRYVGPGQQVKVVEQTSTP